MHKEELSNKLAHPSRTNHPIISERVLEKCKSLLYVAKADKASMLMHNIGMLRYSINIHPETIIAKAF